MLLSHGQQIKFVVDIDGSDAKNSGANKVLFNSSTAFGMTLPTEPGEYPVEFLLKVSGGR